MAAPMGRPRSRSLAPETVKLNVAEVRESIARAQRKQAALVVLQGSESDIGTHVILDRSVTMGRDPKVELPLQDEGISRRHCRVRPEDDHYLVEDLKSTNGTLLNGQLVLEPTKLKAGDRIYLGGCVVKFTDSDAVEIGFHAQMDTLVGKDDLTGLIAKRRFDAAYVRAFDEARTTRTRLSVMFLDLDGLKLINDTHGHPVGAFTISEVGRVIGQVVAASHSGAAACRFGGDEFAAFLPCCNKEGGREVGEAVRSAVAAHTFEKDGIVVRPTLSIGVASYPEDAKSPDLLMRKADEALYRAKKTGRDRVKT
jgi:two-component system, cell cycle response regulator